MFEFEFSTTTAGHEACIAILDVGTDLDVGDATTAIEILGEAEERHAGIALIFLVLVERGSPGPGGARHGKRNQECNSQQQRCALFLHDFRPGFGPSGVRCGWLRSFHTRPGIRL
jgi:hypothetical protein